MTDDPDTNVSGDPDGGDPEDPEHNPDAAAESEQQGEGDLLSDPGPGGDGPGDDRKEDLLRQAKDAEDQMYSLRSLAELQSKLGTIASIAAVGFGVSILAVYLLHRVYRDLLLDISFVEPRVDDLD